MAIENICGLGLSFSYDSFRLLYVGLCIFTWTMSFIFAPRYLEHDKNKKRFYIFSLITLAATIGVFLSGDLFTLFCFFELMSMASYVWVAQEENKKALRAADTYMAVAVIGGLVLLMGILLLYTTIGTLKLSELKTAYETLGAGQRKRILAAGLCMFFGFGAKAGAFPIHIWLPKAHPVAPAPASALLSGVLTKAGIYGIMIVSFNLFEKDDLWGSFVMGIGIITMVLGALLAIFSVDIKRTLACSSVSQIGFILVGVASATLLGEEGGLARYGTLLHMVNHTIVKLAVFLTAGVIYQNLHKLDLNSIKGFGKDKPVLKISFALSGLSLAGVPGFLGYLSKTALHESLLEAGTVLHSETLVTCIEWLFLFSGACTLAYMTKLFICVFLEDKEQEVKTKATEVAKEKTTKDDRYMNIPQLTAIFAPAAMTLGLGISIALTDSYNLFPLHTMKGSLISIGIGIIIYLLFIRTMLKEKGHYLDLWPKALDLEDRLYRPLLLKVLPTILAFVSRIMDELMDSIIAFLRKTIYKDAAIFDKSYEGNKMTHFLGHTADVIKAKVTHKPVAYDIEHKLAMKLIEDEENNSITKRSLSYGLILACAGMFLMLAFILYLVFITN